MERTVDPADYQIFKERLDSKISRQPGKNACWIWIGLTNNNGYGVFTYRGAKNRLEGVGHKSTHWLAHRLMWTISNGTIGDGMVIDHLCQTKICVNPKHLQPVLNSVNAGRETSLQGTFCKNSKCEKMVMRGRKGFCNRCFRKFEGGASFILRKENRPGQRRSREELLSYCVRLKREHVEKILATRYELSKEGCHLWTGEKNSSGYGRLEIYIDSQRHRFLVHRIAYYLKVEKLSDALVIDHKCHNKLCIRPSHLQAVTVLENSSLAGKRSKRTFKS